MDREKVIKGLEICKERNYCCPECPYYDRDAEMGCHSNELMADALALLKEHEAIKPVLDEQTGRLWWCGNCGSYVGYEDKDEYEYDKYCRECGRPVLWEGRRS